MAQIKILILGAKGFLGTYLTKKLKENENFLVFTHSQRSQADYTSDLSDYANFKKLLTDCAPDYCINLLALTDVNECETDHEKAYRLNVTPVKNLVKCVLQENLAVKLIQISTDHMYDKENSSENDLKISNYYAFSKYLADEFSLLIEATVLRTNFFGESLSTKPSFSDWITSSLIANKPLRGYSDVFFNPLHISTLATEIQRVLVGFVPGIYNLGSKNGMSKYDFMLEVGRHKGLTVTSIEAIEYKNSGSMVPRPLDMRTNVTKYESTFRVNLPKLSEEIKKC
jgi:dTDP-4-dehydrorhamnose reductase